MNGFLYTLTLEESVLANSLGGEPNSASSLFYIPGGLVRGAAINAYRGKKAASDPDFARLFLKNSARYLNAYPLVDNMRSLPTPLNWLTKRKPAEGEKEYVYQSPQKDLDTGGVKFHFWAPENNSIEALEEEWQINIHTQRDAELGRATESSGAVYRYIALPAGMQFQGAILTESEIDSQTIQELLGSSILLGKARTAGYGCARIEFHKLPDNWNEGKQFIEKSSYQFRLTLLSPTLVRNRNGQFSSDISTALEAHIGPVQSIKPTRRQEVAGGFNRTWGLPLPQQPAIAAGSVFEVETKDDVPAEKLRALEEHGMGERRAEGFGRVAINMTFPDAQELKKTNPILIEKTAQTVTKNDPTVRLMLTRRMRQSLDEQVIRAARLATTIYEKGKVPNSQLSRWRGIVRDALAKIETQDPLERLRKFKSDSQAKAGWEKMSKARIKIQENHPRLTEWIEELLDNPDTLQDALGDEYQDSWSLGTTTLKTESRNVEYRLRLLDAVLAMMAKMNTEEGGDHA